MGTPRMMRMKRMIFRRRHRVSSWYRSIHRKFGGCTCNNLQAIAIPLSWPIFKRRILSINGPWVWVIWSMTAWRGNQCCNEASKIFVLRRFLAEDPSSSSSSAHFQKSKNLRSFEDFRPKIPKIFEKKSSFVEEILRENGRKWVYFLDRKWEKFLMSKIFIVVNFIRIFFTKHTY